MTYISDKQLKAHASLQELSRASMLANDAPLIVVDHKHQIDPKSGDLKTFIECHHYILRFSISKDAETVGGIQLNNHPADKLEIKFVPGTDGLTTMLQINGKIIESPADLELVLNQAYSEIQK